MTDDDTTTTPPRPKLTPAVIDYLYKKYRTAMKRIDFDMMPRRVFPILFEDASTLAEGEVLLEKFIENLIHQVLEGLRPNLDETPPIRSEEEAVEEAYAATSLVHGDVIDASSL